MTCEPSFLAQKNLKADSKELSQLVTYRCYLRAGHMTMIVCFLCFFTFNLGCQSQMEKRFNLLPSYYPAWSPIEFHFLVRPMAAISNFTLSPMQSIILRTKVSDYSVALNPMLCCLPLGILMAPIFLNPKQYCLLPVNSATSRGMRYLLLSQTQL